MTEEDAPRVTGFAPLDRLIDAWETTPSESVTRRLFYSALLGVGLVMTVMGSIFFANSGPIPLKFIPDLRIFAPFVTGLTAGVFAAFGGASRRKPALWTAVAFTILFHLEEATVFWIGPYPGSITGTRVGLLGTAGSLVALLAVLLLHVEVESTRLKRDLVKRGADDDAAEAARATLSGQGARRLTGLAVGVAGLALLVRAAEAIVGNDSPGGPWVLFAGALLLLALGGFLLRLVTPQRAGQAADADEADALDAS